jgi:hypothetical protein
MEIIYLHRNIQFTSIFIEVVTSDYFTENDSEVTTFYENDSEVTTFYENNSEVTTFYENASELIISM